MAEQLVSLVWHTEKRQVNDLVPYEHNPRKMNAQHVRALETSLTKFGVVEIPAINQDNTLIAGHQRCKVLQLLGRGTELIDVRVPNRQLTETELKEYNIASNAIKGDWLKDILEAQFQGVDLSLVPLSLQEEMDSLVEGQAKKSDEDPVYPIVAQFSEKHDAFILISDNEIDTNHIKELLGLVKSKSYKSEAVGQSHVLTAKEFIRLWNSRS